MNELLPALAAALFAGFLGSAHCLGMCAGISGMVAVNASAKSLAGQLPLALSYNVGRVVSYAALGALVAGFGEVMVAAMPAIAGPVRLMGGLIIILIGLQLAFNWAILAPLERAGAVLWQAVSPFAKKFLPVTNAPRALGLGLLWGLIPCGLVYSALLIAAVSAEPSSGALIMLAFGVGTTPAMVATGIGALQLSRVAGNARRTAGVLIIVLGLLTLAMPVQNLLAPVDHSMHQM